MYEIEPAPRTVADLLPANDSERQNAKPAPEAKHKWLTASVTDDAATVVATMFQEAERRVLEDAREQVFADGHPLSFDRRSAGVEVRRRSRAAPG